MLKIRIINGPNLNLLGLREPHVYGLRAFDDFFEDLSSEYRSVQLTYFQSNHEGAIIDQLHEFGFGQSDGIILNPAAYTHTSIAIGDAIAAISSPVIEVHLSTPSEREPFRKTNFIREKVLTHYEGLGLDSYRNALDHFIRSLAN